MNFNHSNFLNTGNLLGLNYVNHDRCFHSIFFYIAMVFSSITFAQEGNPDKAKIADYCEAMKAQSDCINKTCVRDGKNLCIEQNRFTPYQPNSAVFQQTDRDEHSVEVNYSFRYLISSPDCTDIFKDHCFDFDKRLEHFVTYTGKFDFYVGSRISGPVVNRLSNPAWHSRKYFGDEVNFFDWVDFGFEHKSNGQVVSASERVSGSMQYRADAEYLAGNHAYIDSISRSVNYLSLETKSSLTVGSREGFEFYLKLYGFHFGEESDVHWGDYAGQENVKFTEFERIRSVLNIPLTDEKKYDKKREMGIEWTVGGRGLATDSVNVWVRWPFELCDLQIPLTLRAHAGPMNELSNYTEDQRSYGIGLSFYH